MVQVTSVLLAIILMVILLLAIITILSGAFPQFLEGFNGFMKALHL